MSFAYENGILWCIYSLPKFHGAAKNSVLSRKPSSIQGNKIINLSLVMTKRVMRVEQGQTRNSLPNEPRYEKTGLRGFRPGPTQTGLCNRRR